MESYFITRQLPASREALIDFAKDVSSYRPKGLWLPHKRDAKHLATEETELIYPCRQL